ncbi:helix-turn-helix domain-containing protein [Aeromonas salmonicida]|uniref:AraC family transcriptional regulator n=1 Tax=Aeromonas salmonicida TaxID=645 RepID=A0AAX3VZB4_AERSA|nr:AraC family transcriptional regulator [Aeromonas salmonicida]WHF38244.1 AraC family transcriptional regulator [Aeromonas salmonicida]
MVGKESSLDYRKPVFKAMDYISQHLDDNPSLDEVAMAAAISTFHFHRIFKTMVGETIAGFTRRLRMERAARRLLAAPQSDITTLAIAAGFSSSQNFAKAFRLHFAMSPSEYRQQQGGNWKSKIGNDPLPFETYDGLVMHPVTEHQGLLQGASVKQMPARRVAYMRRMGPMARRPASKPIGIYSHCSRQTRR